MNKFKFIINAKCLNETAFIYSFLLWVCEWIDYQYQLKSVGTHKRKWDHNRLLKGFLHPVFIEFHNLLNRIFWSELIKLVRKNGFGLLILSSGNSITRVPSHRGTFCFFIPLWSGVHPPRSNRSDLGLIRVSSGFDLGTIWSEKVGYPIDRGSWSFPLRVYE